MLSIRQCTKQMNEYKIQVVYKSRHSRNCSWISCLKRMFVVNIQTWILIWKCRFKPLKAELNPICHLLVLLGDLTFIGPCIVSIFLYACISNKMQRYTVYSYLETALHVSGGTSTHLRYLLAKVRTTWGKASDRLRQRANKRNKNRFGRLPTSDQNWKIILSDEVRCRIGKG
jgi:hypothetical protein